MKKYVASVLAMSLLFSVASPVLALEVLVSPDGVMNINREEDVLGVRSDKDMPTQSNSQRVYPSENKSLRVTPLQDNVVVSVGDTPQVRAKATAEERRKSDVSQNKRVSVKFPAGQSAADQQRALDMEMAMLEGEEASSAGDMPLTKKEYMEQLRAERRERIQELAELRNRFEDDGSQGLGLISREVEARLKPGATFELDPDTNVVYLTTPSGNQHMLEHLPDQALERMFSSQELRNADEESVDPLEVETDEEGGLIYRTQVKKVKRFLGLFPREVETEVVLDDDTGDVEVIEEEPETLLETVVNALSF